MVNESSNKYFMLCNIGKHQPYLIFTICCKICRLATNSLVAANAKGKQVSIGRLLCLVCFRFTAEFIYVCSFAGITQSTKKEVSFNLPKQKTQYDKFMLVYTLHEINLTRLFLLKVLQNLQKNVHRLINMSSI